MRIAVTGGAGAIGTHVCDELMRADHDVLCLDNRAPRTSVTYQQVDLTVLGEARRSIQGCQQVVHLAAIPDPYGGDLPETVLGVNTVLSYNVFEASRLEGVERVIYGCSESSTGFGIHHVKLEPRYVPIDEAHPLWPHETYSLSKHFGERIGANYARAFGLEVISLRYVWVWSRRAVDAARQIVAQSRAGQFPESVDGFGAHIAVRDVARACAAAAAYRFPPSDDPPIETFFLAAKDTFYPVPTMQVLSAYLGHLPPIRDQAYFEENPYASVFDIRKAQRLLGWEPLHGWQSFDTWEF